MVKVKLITKISEEFEIYPVKLRLARAIKGWSVCELARFSGVSRKTIERIEKGNCESINKSTFEKLVSALGMKKDYYLSDVDEHAL